VGRKPLIPHFLKVAFNEKRENHKFYLILADSGMGKTTFMINLYVQYHAFLNFRRKQQMKLFRLGDNRTLDQIKAIEQKEAVNTILLLDALDEDPNILPRDHENEEKAFRRRVDEIAEATRDFSDVVITCRTQYFPGQEDDPFELRIRRPDEKGYYTFNKIYLSPLTISEAKQYIDHVYGRLGLWSYNPITKERHFLSFRKKRQALEIVKRTPKLVVRPMLLSYIEPLVDSGKTFRHVADIYEILIERWLKREAEKRVGREEEKDFMENLRRHALQTAVALYYKWRDEKRLWLNKEEAVAIAQENAIQLRPDQITGQSLLTCDALGNWKFAHKSVMEYLLAQEALKSNHLFNALVESEFAGMDFAESFMPGGTKQVFIPGGAFPMGNAAGEDREKPVHQVTLGDFWLAKHPLTVAEFAKFVTETSFQTDADKGGGSYLWNRKELKLTKGVNWRCDVKGNPRPESEYNHPVIHVSWNDATAYCQWLSRKIGQNYRLPTEAEWEYAARGGEKGAKDKYDYAGGNELDELGWYSINSGGETHPVGGKKPNQLGLYDMSGNVLEWCQDWFGDYPTGSQTNPAGPTSGSHRVGRGGSWSADPTFCRVARRGYCTPGYRFSNVGFRLARTF